MGLDGLDFGFLWVGILDSIGVWVGFGLVGWVGVVGSGGSVVGSGLYGCFCYEFAGFLVGFVLFLIFGFLVLVGFWWAEGSGGVVVIVCLVVEKVRERQG